MTPLHQWTRRCEYILRKCSYTLTKLVKSCCGTSSLLVKKLSGSQLEKLVPESHQCFVGLEQRTMYSRWELGLWWLWTGPFLTTWPSIEFRFVLLYRIMRFGFWNPDWIESALTRNIFECRNPGATLVKSFFVVHHSCSCDVGKLLMYKVTWHL